MSVLRARCPRCDTLTAVALGDGYECHSCGAAFGAGLVRVHGAWGVGGDAMAEAAGIALPYPEAAVVSAATLGEQSAAVAASLPRPALVLGGCCCAHVGAIRGLAARHDRLAVVWLDAHGDLNTETTSPSGNAWGMPLRMALDEVAIAPRDVAHLHARALDPPEVELMREYGIDDDLDRALADADAVYVALDADALAPGELACFMPEPGGPTVEDVQLVLGRVRAVGIPVAGLGFTGLLPSADPAVLASLAASLGL